MRKKNDNPHFNRNQYSYFPLENSGGSGQVKLSPQPENPPLHDWNEKENDLIHKDCPGDRQSANDNPFQLYIDHPCHPQVRDDLNLHLQKRDRQKYFKKPSLRILFWFNQPATRLTPFQQKEKRSTAPMDKNQEALVLIRAAALARQKSVMRSFCSDPTPAEQLGIQISLLRRSKNRNLDWLSAQTGYAPEALIAFEAGLLDNLSTLEMLSEIATVLGINIVQHVPAASRFSTIS